MAKLETETKKVINKYYDDKIKYFREFIDLRRKELKDNYIEKFENNDIVKEIRKLYKQLEKNYKDIEIKFDLSIYYYQDFKFLDDIIVKRNLERITDLNNERSLLLLNLENNSKNSKVYKEEWNKFYKKLMKENKQ